MGRQARFCSFFRMRSTAQRARSQPTRTIKRDRRRKIDPITKASQVLSDLSRETGHFKEALALSMMVAGGVRLYRGWARKSEPTTLGEVADQTLQNLINDAPSESESESSDSSDSSGSSESESDSSASDSSDDDSE